MKLHSSLLLAAATLVAASTVHAATVTKDSSGTDLTLGASWGGTAPTSADVATWGAGSLGAGLTIGASTVTWGGINITDTASASVGIAGTGTINTGNITLAGTKTLTIAPKIALNGNSIYDIADVTSSAATDATISGVISGAFGITKTGAGTLVLSGTNTYTGNTTVNNGTLEIGTGGSLYTTSSTQTITVASGATLKISNANNNPLGHGDNQIWNISGTLTEATAGVQILAGNVRLNGGTLTSTAGNATYGSFTVLNSGSTITANGTGNTISAVNLGIGGGLTLNLVTTLSTDTLLASTVIKDGNSAGGKLAKAGAGTVTLTGANTYTGTTTITGGTLDLGGGTATGSISSSSALVLGGGTLSYTRTGNTTQTLAGTTLNAGASAVNVVAGDTVNLGAITRNAGGTIDFGATGAVKTTTGTASTILTAANGAAYATVGGSDWATKNAANDTIVGLSTVGGYTAFTAGTVALSGNADLTGPAGAYSLGANASPTTIRNLVAGNTIDLAGFTLATGGVLSDSNQTISGTGALTAATAGGDLVFIQTANTATVGAIIADNTTASSLTKSGAGTLTLSGANTYTGKTYLDGGVLNIVADNNLGIAPGAAVADQLTINGGTLQFGAGTTLVANRGITLNGVGGTVDTNGFNSTIAGIIAGPAGLTKTGAGTLTLNAANTFTGGTIIGDNSGNVTLGDLGFLKTTSKITIGAGSTLELKATAAGGANRDKLFSATNAGDLVINGTLSNTGTAETRLNYAGTITMNNGTILCNGGETVWGSFLVSANTTITANGASNTISGTGNGIGISSGATLTLDTALATDALAVSAKLGAPTSAFAGAVKKTGLGTVTMSGAAGNNIYTGGLTVAGGTLDYTGAGSVIGTSGAVQIDSGATLKLSGTATNQLETTGVITIAGTLAATNAGVANTFRGTSIILNGGTITSTVANTSAWGAFLVNSAVTINANGTGNTISGASVIGIASTKVLTLNTALVGDTLAVTGTLGQGASGTAGGVTKTGLGTVTFSGANSYTGATAINAGTLLVNGSIAASATATSVASGARLGGSGTVSSAVTVAGGATGGTIRGGTGTVTTDALTIGGKVTLASGSIVELALGSAAGNNHSTLNFNGTGDVLTSGLVFSFLDLGATTGTYTGLITGVDTTADLTGWTITNAGWVGTFSQVGTNINLNLTAVPEPSTYGLIGAGALAGVALVRRRRRHAGMVAA